MKSTFVAVNEENGRQVIGTGHHNASETIRLQNRGPSLCQLVFDWNARDKRIKFKNIAMELTNISLTKHYEQSDTENVSIIKKNIF